MKHITLVLSFGLSISAAAQQWCPPGADWIHGFVAQSATGAVRSQYAGDTVVGGVQAKRIERTIYAYQAAPPVGQPFTAEQHPLITREEGDMVMLWSTADELFDTLMWFGAQPGDHWQFPHFPDIHQFSVLSNGTMDVEGLALDYLVVEHIPVGEIDTLVERLGFLQFYLDPTASVTVDFVTSELVCYRDEVITGFQGHSWTTECDFTLSVAHVEQPVFTLFPNPGTDQLDLQLPEHARSVELLDAMGRSVLRASPTGTRLSLNTAPLSTGCYTVQVHDRAGNVTALRWMKE